MTTIDVTAQTSESFRTFAQNLRELWFRVKQAVLEKLSSIKAAFWSFMSRWPKLNNFLLFAVCWIRAWMELSGRMVWNAVKAMAPFVLAADIVLMAISGVPLGALPVVLFHQALIIGAVLALAAPLALAWLYRGAITLHASVIAMANYDLFVQ